jgi:hypothetical protein
VVLDALWGNNQSAAAVGSVRKLESVRLNVGSDGKLEPATLNKY